MTTLTLMLVSGFLFLSIAGAAFAMAWVFIFAPMSEKNRYKRVQKGMDSWYEGEREGDRLLMEKWRERGESEEKIKKYLEKSEEQLAGLKVSEKRTEEALGIRH